MNEQKKNNLHLALTAAAFLLMAGSAVALGLTIKASQGKYTKAEEMPIVDITEVAPWEEQHPTMEEIEDAIIDDQFKAICMVETGCNCAAWNKAEDACGPAQIREIMRREANNIMGEEFFKSEDRWDWSMSLMLFETVIRHHNPELDIDQTITIWNPGCGSDYRERVKNCYELTKAESLERRGY